MEESCSHKAGASSGISLSSHANSSNMSSYQGPLLKAAVSRTGDSSVSREQGPGQPSASRVLAEEPLLPSQAPGPGGAAVSGEQSPQGQPDQAAQEKTQSGSAAQSAVTGGDESPMQLIGSGVGTPGASKPRPGVRSSAIGPLLARLRREAAED